MAADIAIIREKHEAAKLQLETVKLETHTQIIKKQARPLLEHYDRPPDPFQYQDPVDPKHWPRRYMTRTLRKDREDGKYFPFYETETDIARMRATSRELQAYFPRVVSAIDTLGNYVFGDGFTYTAQAKDGMSPPDELLKRCQAVIDKFTEDNDWSGVCDRERDERARTDGEAILTLHERQHGIDLEIMEPDYLTQPANTEALNDWLDLDFDPSWSFGVLTRRHASRPLGYHFVFGGGGHDWDFMKASHVIHVKRNSIKSAKRGVSDFFSNEGDVKNEQKLRDNTAMGSAIQAALAFIREHVEGVTEEGISSFVSGNATNDYDKVIGGTSGTSTRNVQVEEMRPGTVKDIPFGMKYHAGPLGSLRSPIYLEVAGYVLRAFGGRWSMPEYMISGDASNANFASTLVAESPFVKARERDQGFYKRTDREMFWKVLKIAWGQGLLGSFDWHEIKATVELLIDAPEVASRDRLQQVQVDETLTRMKLKSLRSVSGEHQLDFDQEKKNREDDQDPDPLPTSGPGSAGGKVPGRDQPQPTQTLTETIEKIMEAVKHAPAGGVTINGKEFNGGQFIPSDDLAKASNEELGELERKQNQEFAKELDPTGEFTPKTLPGTGSAVVVDGGKFPDAGVGPDKVAGVIVGKTDIGDPLVDFGDADPVLIRSHQIQAPAVGNTVVVDGGKHPDAGVGPDKVAGTIMGYNKEGDPLVDFGDAEPVLLRRHQIQPTIKGVLREGISLLPKNQVLAGMDGGRPFYFLRPTPPQVE